MDAIKFYLIVGIFFSRSVYSRHLFSQDFLSEFNFTRLLDSKHGISLSQKVCLTGHCKKLAQDILNSIDPTVDPCEDFYSYTCGKWIKQHPVPPTDNHWNQFEILEKDLDNQVRELLEEKKEFNEPKVVSAAKKVYKACMDTDRIEARGLTPLVKLLEDFGDWPIASSDWVEKNFDWQLLVSSIGNKLAISTVLIVYVDVDRKDTSKNIIIIDEPSLVLPKYLLTYSDPGFVTPYLTFVSESARLVADAKGDPSLPFHLFSQSFNMIKFEIQLAMIMRKEEEKKNINDLYDLVSIKKLQEWTDHFVFEHSSSKINWKSLIRNYLGIKEDMVNDDTYVAVTNWNYLKYLMKLIDNTSSRTLANYMLWRVVNKMSRDLNQEMTNLNFQFKSELSAVSEDYPRWYDCVLASGYLSFAVGYMYVKKHFDKEAKSKAIDMVHNIRAAFKQELAEVQWMDEETKMQAKEKADFMNHFIGYPNWFDNVTFLEEYYNGVIVGENHFENKISLREFRAKKLSDSLNVKTNRDEWLASPAIANAFYNPQLNSIIFPAGVLQSPFFSKNQPESINYGSIGAVVGHEITHGFDNLGRQSDKLGNIKQWWSKETEQTYLENSLCFINQYERYGIPELDAVLPTKVKVNGVLTLGENIADNGGLKAALRAYLTYKKKTGETEFLLPGLEHLTSEHLFYIGFARVWCESSTETSLLSEILGDSHSPHRLRVIGSVSNLEHFSSTWKCKVGSNMNPTKKCKLW